MSLGSFAFVPWWRRGAARYIGTSAAAQTPLAVGLQVGGHAATSPPLALRGPGDIIGFDPSAVCRTWPAPGSANAEPDYLAIIEFDQPDLPWRYTPAAPAGDRLAPWLCLIVATSDEFSSLEQATADRPLGMVTITAAAALPDLSQSFAWAHAEAIGETSLAASTAATLMQSSPELVRSRILCPRQLEPNSIYTAFLVPTLELGRLAGLMTPQPTTPVAQPAWTSAPLTLPIYYQWSFSTGDPGDFAILVRELSANPLPDTVALRDMDVSDVSGGTAPIGMGGALTTAAEPKKDLPSADQVKVAARYASALAPNPPAVRPPLYGQAYIGTTPPPWYDDLNHDPRTRAAAGLGAQVVRDHADALLAGAWSQAAGLREANQQMKQWELSRELARSLWTRHVPSNTPDVFLAFIAPIAARVSNGAATVAQLVQGSTLAPGALSPALRRLTRPLGPLALRQKRQAAPALLSKMSSGAWLGSAAVLAPAPTATSTPASAPAPSATSTPARTITLGTTVTSTSIATDRLGDTAALFGTADPVSTLKSAGDTTGLAAAGVTLLEQLSTQPKPGPVLNALNLANFQRTVAAQVNPAAAIDGQVQARVVRNDGRSGAAPFVVAPSFSQAMSQWLTTLSQQWLLPGLGQVPVNTVSLLAINRRFVEAFMIGLNHEMGCRLIFDEYPTELGATFFSSFWNEGAEDIAPINDWATLGANAAPGTPGGDPLVLVIRGDLVRRYPNMQVSAIQASQPGPARTLGSGSETKILFSGRMDPDVAFYGFPLTAAVALGSTTTAGYYFIIQEHPSEPRFGGAIPANSSAAAVAAALLQHPVRLAIYAADLLAEPTSGGS
jgi:hypothetical protein